MKKFLYFSFFFMAITCFSWGENLKLEPFDVPCLLMHEVGKSPGWEDSAWSTAASISEFYKAYPDGKSAYPISIKLLYHGANLFIKADLKGELESGMPAGIAEPAKCEFLWKDSCLNFFVDPDKSNKSAYYHFVNPKGISFQFGRDISKGWKGDWNVKTRINKQKGEWQALIRCNLEVMDGMPPKPGFVWGINFNRHVGSRDGKLIEMSGWPLNHYKPSSRYAMLIFGPEAKEKIKITSASLMKIGRNSFVLRFKKRGKDIYRDDVLAQIKITSRNKSAETVFSNKVIFSQDGNCEIPFEWERTKDGQHLLDVILRDSRGLVSGISNYVFHLSSPVVLNTEKPLIWPEPRIWQSANGYWTMPAQIDIFIDKGQDMFPAVLLKSELKKRYGIDIEILSEKKIIDSSKNSIILDYTKPEEIDRYGYSLEIKPDFIRIKAVAPKFMYYGVRAFIDMIRQSTENGFAARAKCGKCVDWPGVERRAFMFYPEIGLSYKVKPSMDVMKKLIYEQVAGGRFDMLILVIKGSMKYDSHPELLNNPAYRGKYYTKAEIKELIDYARRHYLEVIPGGDSPGHSEWIGEPCPELREDGNSEIVCSRNPGTMKILKDTYSELLDLFAPCDFLFISGGEIFYSTALTPPEKRCKLCMGIDKGTLLLEHWKELNAFCNEKKVKPVIWSDMISKDWNGGGRWQTAKMLNDVPRNITITSWDPTDNRTIQPEEIISMGFPKPWRITTVFAEQQVDSFLKNYKHYQVEGIAEDYPWLWCNFQAGSVETSCSYTTPAIHIFADCAWNPDSAAEDYFRHINSRGPYWSRLMNVPEWGTRKLVWNTVSISQASNINDCNLPKGEESIGGISFEFEKNKLNAISVSGKDSESKGVKIARKVLGLAFMHTLDASKNVREKLHHYFLTENTDQYGMNIAYIKVIYADKEEVLVPLKLGWNTNFYNCYSPARVMPGADFYWTCASEGQKQKNPAERDICYWFTSWKNPYPDNEIKEIKLIGNSDTIVTLAGVSVAEKTISQSLP